MGIEVFGDRMLRIELQDAESNTKVKKSAK
jgi:hypothetical protein